MSNKKKAADEAYEDLDRIFPGTAKAKKPRDKYEGPPVVLLPNDDDEPRAK